jgi:hypothetical protein
MCAFTQVGRPYIHLAESFARTAISLTTSCMLNLVIKKQKAYPFL